MTNRRQLLKSGVSALIGFNLASCGWKLGNVRAHSQTKNSDEIDIFTWTQYTDEELLKNFKAQSGIKVRRDVYDANEVMLAKLQASGGGTYSVIYPSDYMVEKMVNQGLLTELNQQRLIGFNNFLPQFENPQYDVNNSHSVPLSWGTTGLIYNSEKLKTAPEDWEYLWQNSEQLSKRMTLLNDAREVIGATLKMLGYSYNSQNEDHIKEAYEKLQALKPTIAAFDTDTWRNQILAGDLLLAMCYSSDAFKITQQNPALKYVTPKSGSSLWTDTVAIPKSAPNLEGAYAWINYLLQPEVASQLCLRLGIATPIKTAFELLPENIRNNTTLFPDSETIQKCDRLTPVGESEAVYELYWTQLTSS